MRKFYNFSVVNPKDRKSFVDRNNQWCPLHKIVGQDSAVETVSDLCYSGLSNFEHKVDENIMLVGPPSCGKTTMAKAIIDTLLLVGVITDGTQLKNNSSIANLILSEWAKVFPLSPSQDYDGILFYEIPPCIVFIDEIHATSKAAQDGLLKATERKDGMLFSKKYVLDCKNVFWIGATTDWGKLIPAFRTRFRRIDLEAPDFGQVVQMVKKEMKFDDVVSNEIVKFGGCVPREAMAFARAVKNAALRSGLSLIDSVKEVATREGIDECGMKSQRLRILIALKDHPEGLLLRNLIYSTKLTREELLIHWLPPMLTGKNPLVIFDGNYCLSKHGVKELEKRGL